jgi:hypothetical protein
MQLYFALFNAIITTKLAQSGKLGRLLRLGSCAATGFAFAFMGIDQAVLYLRNSSLMLK